MSFEFVNYMVIYKDSKTASFCFSPPPLGKLAGLPAFHFHLLCSFFPLGNARRKNFLRKGNFAAYLRVGWKQLFPRGKAPVEYE